MIGFLSLFPLPFISINVTWKYIKWCLLNLLWFFSRSALSHMCTEKSVTREIRWNWSVVDSIREATGENWHSFEKNSWLELGQAKQFFILFSVCSSRTLLKSNELYIFACIMFEWKVKNWYRKSVDRYGIKSIEVEVINTSGRRTRAEREKEGKNKDRKWQRAICNKWLSLISWK